MRLIVLDLNLLKLTVKQSGEFNTAEETGATVRVGHRNKIPTIANCFFTFPLSVEFSNFE